MATKQKDTHYRDAKDAFDTLAIEDKAVFLVDAAFSTILKGMEHFASAVSDAVDGIVDRRHESGDNAEAKPAAKKSAAKRASKKSAASGKASSKRDVND